MSIDISIINIIMYVKIISHIVLVIKELEATVTNLCFDFIIELKIIINVILLLLYEKMVYYYVLYFIT